MVALSDLPPFKIRKPSIAVRTRSQKSREETEYATNKIGQKDVTPRLCFQFLKPSNVWNTAEAQIPPKNWPSHLHWPNDIFEATLYTAPKPDIRKPNLRRSPEPCLDLCCPNPNPRPLSEETLCHCVNASWEFRNTHDWFTKNISLQRHADPDMGFAAIARTSFPAGIVLGDYFGELLPESFIARQDAHSEYLMDIRYHAHQYFGVIDAARVGSWTRFINHSCKPNTVFAWLRVGRRMRICVRADRRIERGEELTVNYEDTYWRKMMELGRYCKCETDECKYREVRRRREVGQARV